MIGSKGGGALGREAPIPIPRELLIQATAHVAALEGREARTAGWGTYKDDGNEHSKQQRMESARDDSRFLCVRLGTTRFFHTPHSAALCPVTTEAPRHRTRPRTPPVRYSGWARAAAALPGTHQPTISIFC